MATINPNLLGQVYYAALPMCLSVLEQELGLVSLEFIPKDGPLSLQTNDGQFEKLFLPPDFSIGRTTMIDKAWQIKDPQIFANQLSKEGKCCLVDIGANVGLFTRQLLHWAPDKIHEVYMYEPDPFNYELLKKNIPRDSKKTFVNSAVSSSSESSKDFFKDPLNSGNYSFYQELMPTDGYERINVSTISASSQIDAWRSSGLPIFYKSDTQGHDILIACSCGLDLWKQVKCAMLELWPIRRLSDEHDQFLNDFASILDLFPIKVFGDNLKVNITTSEVFDFLNDSNHSTKDKDIFLFKDD